MESFQLKLALYRDNNLSDESYWSSHKLGEHILDDVFDFAIRSNNFTIEYIFVPEDEVDERSSLFKMLAKGEADLMTTRFIPSKFSGKNFSITNAFQSTYTTLLASNVATYKEPLYTAYVCLSYECYICIFISLVLLAITTNLVESMALCEIFSLRNCCEHVWKCIGDLLLKPRRIPPRSYRGRFLYILLMTEIIVVMAFYNGSFQAEYTTLSDQRIDAFQDLLGKRITILFSNSSGSLSVFKKTILSDPKYKSLSSRMRVIDRESYIQALYNGSLTFGIVRGKTVIIDSVENFKIMLKNSTTPEKLRIGETRYFPTSIVFYTHREMNSSLKDVINGKLSRFVETEQGGPFQRKFLFVVKESRKHTEVAPPPESLTTTDLLPIFGISAIGNVLALLCGIYELCAVKQAFCDINHFL